MPIYSYICNSCKKHFEIFYSFEEYNSKPKPKCVHCNHKKTSRLYAQDIPNLCGFIKKNDSELKTLGDLANRNRDRMSKDKQIELFNKHNQYKKEDNPKDLPKGMSRIKKTNTKNRWY